MLFSLNPPWRERKFSLFSSFRLRLYRDDFWICSEGAHNEKLMTVYRRARVNLFLIHCHCCVKVWQTKWFFIARSHWISFFIGWMPLEAIIIPLSSASSSWTHFYYAIYTRRGKKELKFDSIKGRILRNQTSFCLSPLNVMTVHCLGGVGEPLVDFKSDLTLI